MTFGNFFGTTFGTPSINQQNIISYWWHQSMPSVLSTNKKRKASHQLSIQKFASVISYTLSLNQYDHSYNMVQKSENIAHFT